jgi:hypothetical protein
MRLGQLRLILAVAIIALACNIGPPPPTLDPAQNEFGIADFGDAPDPNFPTLLARDGARAQDPSRFWLGSLGAPPSTEPDAKIVNRDETDDGLVELLVTAGKVFVTFQAVKSPDAGPGIAYFNLLADSNGDGKWQDFTAPGGVVSEWVVVNRALNLAPGETVQIKAEFLLTQGSLVAWVRATLTDTPAPDGWNGTGRFAQGEVEDHRIGPADDWNVECNPNPLKLDHGNAGNITLRVVGGRGAPTQFKIGSVVGTPGLLGDPAAKEITVGPLGVPAPDPGYTLFGAGPHLGVTTKRDEPARTIEYTIEVRVEAPGRVETEKCIVRVIHAEVKPAATATSTITLTRTPVPRPTVTPTKPKPSVNVNSPVKLGTELIVRGQNFPPGLARKLVLDPTGKTVYNLEVQIPITGMLSATFYITGPTGRWTLVIRFSNEEIQIPFDVIR